MSTPVQPKPSKGKPPTTSKPPPSKKRASPDPDNNAPKKRRKTQPGLSSKETLSSPSSELSEVEKPQPGPKPKTKKLTQKSTQAAKPAKLEKKPEPVHDATESEVSDPPEESAIVNNIEASDSELSVLIDEEPPPKKKRKGSSTAAEKRGTKASAPKIKAAGADINDPDQAEIKRLQGWLVKCGIRKLWGKELKPYESSKAKIKHLKEMLADAGMTGRHSIEKASQIKEARELKADIEAVKEGAERWGKEKDAEELSADSDGRTKPKRRLVRGAQVLDFLSSDGEETD